MKEMPKTMANDIKYLSVPEFIDEGYLQEANRQFFHPLGLALEANPETGEIKVWDYRDDPEGILFSQEILHSEETARKMFNVGSQMGAKFQTRKDIIGDSHIQNISLKKVLKED